jgi:hypothetical protein
MSFEYIKDHLKETVGLIAGFTLLLNTISYNPINTSSDFDWLTKALIIAHIIYEEMHIFKDVPKIINKTKDFFELLPWYYNK